MRAWSFLILLLVACGPAAPRPDGGAEADGGPAADSGVDGGTTTDAGAAPDAGAPVPEIVIEKSLFWNDAGLIDDPQVISFARLMALASSDGHGGALLSQWFHRFATTAHSERALPAQFIDAVAAAQGADPTTWDLGALPFKVTGIHNRVDLARDGHCGELRVSVSCTDPTLQPFHALFLFRQPLGADASCEATARRWAALSARSGAELDAALRALLAQGLTAERFLMIETVEFTLAPWEWRQWLPAPDGGVENPPLFQQVDVERLNAPGPLRDDFLTWVDSNAAALQRRELLIPERFRGQSTRVTQGVPRVPLALSNVTFPDLRQQVELVGCAACHTADADFVQTRTDRTVSRFYEKELQARARHLAAMARGQAPLPPFGPLQPDPVLPP